MKSIFISKHISVANEVNHLDTEIHLFTQFFIHKQSQRNEELRYCLRANLVNPHVTRVHLLNERIYTNQDLGLSETDQEKLVQHNTLGKRLTFQMVFQYIRDKGIRGYLVFLNADIFLDTSVQYLCTTGLHESREMLALLRYEYKGEKNPDGSPALEKCPLFGPRFDSQDTWIIHSNYMIKPNQEKTFGYEFGKPGCDNKFLYLMTILGYQVYNDPTNIRTYHFHRSIARDYLGKAVIPPPWGAIVPAGIQPLTIPPSLGINMNDVFRITNGFHSGMFTDNILLYDFITEKIQKLEPFVIPRIAGLENNIAVFTRIKKETGRQDFDGYFQQTLPTMKNNAGIMFMSPNSMVTYSDLYLKSFENCEIYTGWDAQGEVLPHIAQSHEYIRGQFAATKKMAWAFALDIFHYIYHPKLWTTAMRGKRILVISPFIESIREKVSNRKEIYDGVDIFPDCTFIYVKPPQTQGQQPARDFTIEFEYFKKTLDNVKDHYDIALVSCGGYGNVVCNYLFETHRKSAIYVGGVLQMYFGILGGRWLKERPDVLRLFMNSHWSRPKPSEIPAGSNTIEGGCYW